MPLSDHEQRVLEQLERQLHADDPRLATRMTESRGAAASGRRIILGVLLAAAGLAVVLVGVSTRLVPVGVLGTVLIGAGILVATLPARGRSGIDGTAPGVLAPEQGRAPRRRQSAFMQRLERDWEGRGRQEP